MQISSLHIEQALDMSRSQKERETMPQSVVDSSVKSTIASAFVRVRKHVNIGGTQFEITTPFPSPEEWRDYWIYFVMVDRFHNPSAPPIHQFDSPFGDFQGGTINGVREKLPYLKSLGAGALWLTPVLKNCQYESGTYHGYGIQDFLSVDPRFASNPAAARINPTLVENELRALVDEAHALGLYVIFDIVLNHCGNVFGYVAHGSNNASTADYNGNGYGINWHDEHGAPSFGNFNQAPNPIPPDAAVWPLELQRNDYFRRKGKGGESGGDFESLKELVTEYGQVREVLIKAHQYVIAKFDVDAFRIDTLKYVEPDFARTFANSMREFALSIGKKNFFTFGEVYDDEQKISEFIGRNAGLIDDPIGVDAALDFPLFFKLPGVLKGQSAPSTLASMYERRKVVQKEILTSHGEAGKYFVTFLDNHDMKNRFYYQDPAQNSRFNDQLTLGVTTLLSLQGVPCVYYGTEQGLHGSGDKDWAVREALWGKVNAFDEAHPFYVALSAMTAVRNAQPALRYGRQYFRPLSGDGVHFGISPYPEGVVAFSRVLNDQEVLVIANTHSSQGFSGEIIVDASITAPGASFDILFSNISAPQAPSSAISKNGGSVVIHEVNGGVTNGPARTVHVNLRAMEVQILRLRL